MLSLSLEKSNIPRLLINSTHIRHTTLSYTSVRKLRSSALNRVFVVVTVSLSRSVHFSYPVTDTIAPLLRSINHESSYSPSHYFSLYLHRFYFRLKRNHLFPPPLVFETSLVFPLLLLLLVLFLLVLVTRSQATPCFDRDETHFLFFRRSLSYSRSHSRTPPSSQLFFSYRRFSIPSYFLCRFDRRSERIRQARRFDSESCRG